MSQIRDELNKWGGLNLASVSSIKSPEHLSYWLAANLPISDTDKIEILTLNSCIQRLRKEINLMKKVGVIISLPFVIKFSLEL